MSKKTRTIDFNSIARVLIIKLRHHGDVLLTSPVFQVLKNHYPHLEIDALVYADTREMLSEHPALNHLFTIDKGWKKLGLVAQYRHEHQLNKKLIARDYDLIIHLTEHNRGMMLARKLKSRYAITAKWQKRSRLWQKSFTHLYPLPDSFRHTVEKHLDALRHLGLHPEPEERKLVFNPGGEAAESIDGVMNKFHIDQNNFILFHPTSRWMFKSWDFEKAAELLNLLINQGQQVVVTASPSEVELAYIQHMLNHTNHDVINLAGKTNLNELGELINRASCFVGMDSVPMHLAAAMGTPTVALFGPSGEHEWGPWMVKHKIISSNLSCRPCNIDGCGGGKISDCLMQIQPETVLAAVTELLEYEPT